MAKTLTREAVEAAVAEHDALGEQAFLAKYGAGSALKYVLEVDGRRYASKAIVRAALMALNGDERLSGMTRGNGVKPALEELGFRVVVGPTAEPPPPITYVKGAMYSRKLQVQPDIGGNAQAGIFYRASGHRIGLLDTERGLDQNLYANGWLDDGRFQYSGQGRVGDQKLTGANLEVLNHSINGKQLLLFSQAAKGAHLRFHGEMVVEDFIWTQGKDTQGNQRRLITFRMRPIEAVQNSDDRDRSERIFGKLEELRAAALIAASIPPNAARSSERTVYERSRIIRDYVLARADGRCEGCSEKAPFKRSDGMPYLEPHHIHRVSDGGPDHPASVIALCPNCHRRVHFGIDGAERNAGYLVAMDLIEPRARC